MTLVAAAVGSWLAYRAWDGHWPARVVLDLGEGGGYSLGFSPDGKTFLTTYRGGIVPWDARTGARGKPWTAPVIAAMRAGAFSSDGRWFAASVVSADRTTKVMQFDVASGRPRAGFEEPRADASRLEQLGFSPDGRSIVASYLDSRLGWRVARWDASTGRETSMRAPPVSPRGASSAAVTRDGGLIASQEYGVILADVDSEVAVGQLIATPTWSPGIGLAFSSDGKTLAVGRPGGSVELWDVANQRLIRSVPVHRGGYESSALAFSPDGRVLMSTGIGPGASYGFASWSARLANALPFLDPPRPPEVVVVEVATGKSLATARGATDPVASPDGRRIATREMDGTIKIRDLPPSRLP